MPLQTNIVTALPSEAQPIIEFFGLHEEQPARNAKVWGSDNLRLIISGVGKAASAAAVGYLAGAAAPDIRHAWLNIGIAGHASAPVGTIGLAHSIVDIATNAVAYPSIVFNSPCHSYPLACYDQPTTDYPDDTLCDMESSAFFSAASRFSELEFVHLLKIVSDNSAAEIEALSRAKINALLKGQLEVIDKLIIALTQLDAKHRPCPLVLTLDELLKRWHFTVTQQVQLRELARRWALLKVDQAWPPEAQIRECTTAREVLAQVSDMLASTAFRFSGSCGR